MGNTSFTIEEVRILSDIIKCIYDPALTLSEFTEVFMAKLKSLIYFDKKMCIRDSNMGGQQNQTVFGDLTDQIAKAHPFAGI